jgi:hypothetical protein
MGSPGTPLARYGVAEIRRAFAAPKPCTSTCPIAYAHHASRLDGWRSQRGEELPDAHATPPPGTFVPLSRLRSA